MTTLDQRLYAWLLESDDRRFERAFKAYFEVAYPSVLRHLARLSRWDPVHLEDLAQDALLRFFDRVGRARRKASDDVTASLPQVRPLNVGVFHERHVINWTRNVGTFHESSMGFRLPELDDTQWKTSIRAITDKIPALQGQGWQLLHALHLALHWTFDDLDLTAATPTEGNCEERLVEEMRINTQRAAVAERDHPGTAPFVQGTAVIVRALPHLRVPTNGYLFEIARTLYLDECKKRGRQKRGGTGVLASAEFADRTSNHPIERFTVESFAGDDGEEPFHDAIPVMGGNGVADTAVPSVDPTVQYENADLFEKFYAYLRRPLDDAVEALHDAEKQGKAAAERRKVESLTQKFSRTMSVLSVMGEGYSQEQTAERLGLSRNQVKYMVELVQEAFAQFTAETTRPASPANAVSGTPHVI